MTARKHFSISWCEAEKVSDSSKKPDDNEHQLLLDRFLQKAKPILAVERGLNERSRAKLKRLADEHHVNDETFARALKLIQSGEAAKSNLTRYERSFAKFLRRELKGISESILPARLEQKAVDIAFDKFQLEPQRAKELIQMVCVELGLSRISRTESERHVVELVSNLIGYAPYVTEDIRERLYSAGEQWGMERGYLDSLIIAKLTENREAESRKRTKALGWLPLMVTTIVVGVGLGGILIWYTQGNQPNNTDPPENPVVKDIPLVDRLPEWWNDDVKLKAVTLRHQLPVLTEQMENLASDDATNRLAAYSRLATAFVDQIEITDHENDIAMMLGFWYCNEPDISVSQQWLEHICRYIELPSGKIPEQPNASERSFQANQLLAIAANTDSISQQRLDQIDSKTTRLIGWSVKQSIANYLAASNKAIARDYWNHLILNASTNVPVAIDAFNYASVTTKYRLERDSFSQFQLRFIESILASDPGRFEDLQSAIRPLIADAPVHQLASLAKQIRNVKNSSDQKWLVERFLSRIDVAGSRNIPQSVDLIEEHFGVIPPDIVRYRSVLRDWQNLVVDIDANELGVMAREPSARQIADIAHANTIGWFILNDVNSPRLDAKLKQQAIDLEMVSDLQSIEYYAPFDVSILRSSSSDQRALQRYIEDLDFVSQRNSARRSTALKKLAEIALKFRDLDRNQSGVLSAYILSSSADLEEWATIQSQLSSFSHWPNLLISFCDALSDPRISFERATVVANQLTNGRVSMTDEDSQWRSQLKSALLNYVAFGLQQRAVSEKNSPSANWRALQFFLAEQLHQRSILLQHPNTQTNESPTSGSIEIKIINLLQSFSLNPEHQQLVKRRQKAARLITRDEVSQTILLYQWSVELLANQLKTNHPEKTAQLESVLNDYHLAIRNSTTIAQQLYVCELAQLKMIKLVVSQL